MSAKKIVKSQKRENILLSAMNVFARKGINNTTIKDIAIEAGIGKGTIYEYFIDKNEIISSAFSFFMGTFDSGIERIVLEETGGKRKLLMIFGFFFDFLREDRNQIINLTFDFWAESIRAKDIQDIIYREMRNFYRSYRKLISDIISEGKSDGSFSSETDEVSLASLLVGMLDGVMVQRIIDKDQIDLLSIENELNRLINSEKI